MIFRLRTQQKQLLVKRNWKAAQKFSYFEVYGVICKISRSKPFCSLTVHNELLCFVNESILFHCGCAGKNFKRYKTGRVDEQDIPFFKLLVTK